MKSYDDRATSRRTEVIPKSPPWWPEELAPALFSLRQVGGSEDPAQWSGDSGRCSIGSHPSNDLVLQVPTVSRFHCELRADSEGVRVCDVGSSNGTVLDGVRVVNAFLREGSRIEVGDVTLEFRLRQGVGAERISESTSFGSLVGTSIAMRRAFALLERAAESESTVLIVGETGTGKEGAAAAIHENSRRGAGPCLVVDCGAIPPNLIESELFGYERGAFTGAERSKTGTVEEANGGTIFLDEIGELPTDLQPKLLRFLEERTVRRVGGTVRKKVDVRVVAATNRDLRQEVNEGAFRSDLYYRLAVMSIRLPPLRERISDLPHLVTTLLSRLGAQPDQVTRFTSRSFMQRLRWGAWHGNVRELRNHIERCLVMDEEVEPLGTAPSEESVPLMQIDASLPYADARRYAIALFEREYARELIDAHSGNVTRAAKQAGIDRVYLHKLLRRHRIPR
ncbi:MAG: sigma 54-interacting transcriptional regulator [Myxococcota bacterium]